MSETEQPKKKLPILIKLFLGLIIFVLFLFIIVNFPVRNKNKDMKFGVSFSSYFAKDLGLDWKKVYLDILDDLKPKKIRIAAYWPNIEKNDEVEYDFSDLEFQLKEAKERNVEVVLSVGIKVPRWPECHIPEKYLVNKEERESALLKYEKALFEKYKDFENIKIWQIENEPFLAFGDCIKDATTEELLDKEIAQAREVLNGDAVIMTTDSGELSLWYKAAQKGDIFGTTLYRMVHSPKFGYVTYPIGPSFFRIKTWLVRAFTGQGNVIISELQAEPWGPKRFDKMDFYEQEKTMNPEKFREIIVYSQKTNFPEAYLWGAEWWWWLKEAKDKDEMWNEAKKVITKR